MIRACAALLAMAVAGAAPAIAETVYVHAGQEEGQGWVFAHATGCWVATAGHVVKDERVGVIAVGAGGALGQGDLVLRDTEHDLALIRLAGQLARSCPASPIGDRDVLPMLQRVQREGVTIVFERRDAQSGTTGISYGVENVQMQLLAVSEASPTFTLRPERNAADALFATDSGAPIRFRGTGIGEAGLPLGIVLSTDRERSGVLAVVALRMDVVRAFFERSISANAPGAAERDAPFTVAAFGGETKDTSCGPLNLLVAAARCGWRAVRTSLSRPIEITLDLGEIPEIVNAIEVRFGTGPPPKAVVVSTSSELGQNAEWLGERYCPISLSARRVTCTLGVRTVRGVRIVVDGPAADITGIKIVAGRESR